MNLVAERLRVLSFACSGLFAGAMLTEALVLVPYWRSLPAGEFFSWYAANAERLVGFFGPLTWLAALVAIAAGLASLWTRHPARSASVASAALMLVVVSTFFLYFGRANASFAAASLDAALLPAELQRWATWHWVRTGLSLGALALAFPAFERERCRASRPVESGAVAA